MVGVCVCVAMQGCSRGFGFAPSDMEVYKPHHIHRVSETVADTHRITATQTQLSIATVRRPPTVTHSHTQLRIKTIALDYTGAHIQPEKHR